MIISVVSGPEIHGTHSSRNECAHHIYSIHLQNYPSNQEGTEMNNEQQKDVWLGEDEKVGRRVKLSQLSVTLIQKRKDTLPPAMRTVVIKAADNNKE